MSEERPKKKMTNKVYQRRIPVYDTHACYEQVWKRIARRRGVGSLTDLARMLVREEAGRLGIPVPENGEEKE